MIIRLCEKVLRNGKSETSNYQLCSFRFFTFLPDGLLRGEIQFADVIAAIEHLRREAVLVRLPRDNADLSDFDIIKIIIAKRRGSDSVHHSRTVGERNRHFGHASSLGCQH